METNYIEHISPTYVCLYFLRYSEQMGKLSAETWDTEKSPLDRAVWWTEFVLRHHGAPFLKHDGINLNWYQFYNLDIIVLFTSIIAVFVLTVLHFK